MSVHIYPPFVRIASNTTGFVIQAGSYPWTVSRVTYYGYTLVFPSCLDSGANKEGKCNRSCDILLQLQRAYSRQCEELKFLRNQLANRERRIKELEEQVHMLQLQQRKTHLTHK